MKLLVPYLYNFPTGLDVYFILIAVSDLTFSNPLEYDSFGFDIPDTNESKLPLWDMKDLLAQGIIQLATVRTKSTSNRIRAYKIPYVSYGGDDVSAIRTVLNTAIGQSYRGSPIVSYSLVSGRQVSIN